MDAEQIIFTPIGLIHTPFQDPSGMPIQPSAAEGTEGLVVVDPAYQKGLQDLEGFSHLVLVYFFHQAGTPRLRLKPFLDNQKRGVFATRAPRRPNRIGISIVKLLEIKGNKLRIADVDILDGTPLLDIKPYVPDFDHPQVESIGWLEKSRGKIIGKISDDRFVD